MAFIGKRVKPKIEEPIPADCKMEQSFTNAAEQLAATGTAHVQSVGGHVLQSDTEILQADGTTVPVVGAIKDAQHDLGILERRIESWNERFAKVEQALATIARRVAEIEKPDYPELINRRWVELKELVEFISVVTRQDVLGNVLKQMRVSKREIESQLRSGSMAGPGNAVSAASGSDNSSSGASKDEAGATSAATVHAGREAQALAAPQPPPSP